MKTIQVLDLTNCMKSLNFCEGFFDEFKNKYYEILGKKISKWDKKDMISEMMYSINSELEIREIVNGVTLF